MNLETSYIDKIKKSIFFNEKNIKQIKNIDFIKILKFSKDNIEKVNQILENNKLEEFQFISDENLENEDLLDEDLLVVKFYDQDNDLKVATIYDNDKLWQDPEVIRIFSNISTL